MSDANHRSKCPVVVITGASAGIGRAAVRKFAQSGYDVGLIARGADAANGYQSQQTSEPRDPSQPDNLWNPLDAEGGGDYGAHGSFDDRARSSSPMLTVAESRLQLELIATVALGVLVGAWARRQVSGR